MTIIACEPNYKEGLEKKLSALKKDTDGIVKKKYTVGDRILLCDVIVVDGHVQCTVTGTELNPDAEVETKKEEE
jgi:hypothetical protein